MGQYKEFEFVPFSSKQKKIMTWWCDASPFAEYKMIMCYGSVRSGKTIAMIQSYIFWTLLEFDEGNDHIIAGATLNTIKRNVINPLRRILNSLNIDFYFNASDNILKIGRNTYQLFGALNDTSQKLIQGFTAASCFLDEVGVMPRSFVEMCLSRCSEKGAKTWLNMNPLSPYSYLYTDYIQQKDEKKIFVLKCLLEDNPSLSQDTIDYYKTLFSGVFYKRNILGEFTMSQGVVYDAWSNDNIIKRDNIPFDDIVCYDVGVDYGTSTVFTAAIYGYTKDKKVYLIEEYYYDAKKNQKQLTDSECADVIEEFLQKYKVTRIYIDPSASSFRAELRKRKIFKLHKTDNDVVNGIRYISQLIKNKNFLVCSDCKDTIREFATYVWDEAAQERTGQDAVLKVNDHAMDRNRYAIYSRQYREITRYTGQKPSWSV